MNLLPTIKAYSGVNIVGSIVLYLDSLKSGWEIKFLGNVKKLISINYLIEISFFDMHFIIYSS
ncbi:hypothetical protein ABEE95_10855, partial [Staphylococcus aureus]|uniref:hypothetical protein n=1 Tax=Staphylococcus aureus TaxID=1280 RepID=UPI00321A7CDF